MGGLDERTGLVFGYMGFAARLRLDHPLRAIRALTAATLAAMECDLASLYSEITSLDRTSDALARHALAVVRARVGGAHGV